MEVKSRAKAFTKNKSFSHLTILISIGLFSLFLILILFHAQASPFGFTSLSTSSASWDFFKKWRGTEMDANLSSKLQDLVTFLPLKDIRFAKTAVEGNTWFMNSLIDTYEENESQYLYLPSEASKGRLLCLKGNDKRDGTKNSYALAWPEGLPNSTTLLKGLTFDAQSHQGWYFFHWGELRDQMGWWIQNVMQASFGQVPVEVLEKGDDGPYCFEKAVVMRHNVGKIGKLRKLQVSDLLRCKAREFCGINPAGRRKEVNVRGQPSIRLTLLMTRGSRSFKDPTAGINVFSRQCAMVDGCMLEVVQSEDLNFCDQLTNMLFMNGNSSIMEFFSRGWLKLARVGQNVYHWMADQSGMKHRCAWWDPHTDKECPDPTKQLECFLLYKDSQLGHTETYFAEWARTVLKQVRTSKQEQTIQSSQ
ncbi:uncharacterized protein LOC117619865 [Prunus dulcis]|uniref:uncharacterized protein LOC117619865 n=1 Tax=Prunus dulcis TaxID=3755 RepID=UPI00148246A4|nr:uncharacterized protein LOC117619865 [Prunus dulcis]